MDDVTDVTIREHTVMGLEAATTYTVKLLADISTGTINPSAAEVVETLQGEFFSLL